MKSKINLIFFLFIFAFQILGYIVVCLNNEFMPDKMKRIAIICDYFFLIVKTSMKLESENNIRDFYFIISFGLIIIKEAFFSRNTKS